MGKGCGCILLGACLGVMILAVGWLASSQFRDINASF